MTASEQFEKSVAIVGFGYIGSVIGAVLAANGYRVGVLDSNPATLAAVRKGECPVNEPGLAELLSRVITEGRLSVMEDPRQLAAVQTVVCTVGTPLSEEGAADLSQITAASQMMAEHVADGALVVLKSTVPVGTTHDHVWPEFVKVGKKVALAFCPERLAEGQAIRDLRTIPVVVGGVDQESTRRAAQFWSESLAIDVIAVRDSRVAEMVKLSDNLWIDLNIALANELAVLCDALGIDALEVIRGANSLPKGQHFVNILQPSMGVGGYCLTKDPWFVHRMGLAHGVDLATPVVSRGVNDKMPAYAVERISKALEAQGKSIGLCAVAVMGVAFKNNTGDCRYSPTIPAIRNLGRLAKKVSLYDPWVLPFDRQAFPDSFVDTAEDALEGAECVAFFTGHDEFRAWTPARLSQILAPQAVVFDGRALFNTQQIFDFEALGIKYVGVGR